MADKGMPFVLFPLVDISTDTINQLLNEAVSGTGVNALWLAKSDYSEAPKKEKHKAHQGDELPIGKGYKSPFKGKKVEDAAHWLRNKPDDVDLNEHFFAIFDKSAERGDVVICRIGGKDLNNPEDLDYIRLDVFTGVTSMRGGDANWFDQCKNLKGPAKIEY